MLISCQYRLLILNWKLLTFSYILLRFICALLTFSCKLLAFSYTLLTFSFHMIFIRTFFLILSWTSPVKFVTRRLRAIFEILLSFAGTSFQGIPFCRTLFVCMPFHWFREMVLHSKSHHSARRSYWYILVKSRERSSSALIIITSSSLIRTTS